MTPWQQLLLVWTLAALAQGIAWARQQRSCNAGSVDVVWSFGLGAAERHRRPGVQGLGGFLRRWRGQGLPVRRQGRMRGVLRIAVGFHGFTWGSLQHSFRCQ